MTYSAEAAGNDGNVRCHVVRRHFARDRRAHYTIFVSNETSADAQALAFVPETAAGRYRTIAQMAAGPGSDFSTSAVLDITPYGFLPELRVAVTSGDVEFTLAVPRLSVADAQFDDTPDDAPSAAPTTPPSAERRPQPPALRNTFPAPIRPHITTVREPAAEPPRTTRATSRPRTPAVTPILSMLLAGYLLIGAFLIARPRVADFALPATTAPDSSVPVLYHTSGLGAADYTVLGPNAEPVAEGPLALGSGSFSFTVPKASAAQAYLVRVRVQNVLGSAVAEDYLHVPAAPATPAPRPRHVAPPLPPPQIHSLALDRASVASGETLNVYYDIAATSGTIALVDPAAQITYGKSQLDMSGHASFVAPRTDIARFLTVIVTAQRGKATTESRTGVSLTPPVPSVAQGNPVDAGVLGGAPADAVGTAPSEPSALIISAPTTVRWHQTIHVNVSGAAVGLQLVLLDGFGNEIEKHDLPAGQSTSAFHAPAVRSRTQFLFEATSARGAGSETIVRPIVVLP
jgi:hypothetical protein